MFACAIMRTLAIILFTMVPQVAFATLTIEDIISYVDTIYMRSFTFIILRAFPKSDEYWARFSSMFVSPNLFLLFFCLSRLFLLFFFLFSLLFLSFFLFRLFLLFFFLLMFLILFRFFFCFLAILVRKCFFKFLDEVIELIFATTVMKKLTKILRIFFRTIVYQV